MENILDERRFLNKNGYHSVAAICCTISKGNGGFYFIDVEFNISDCNRVITLDLNTNSEADLDNNIFKMQQLIDACTNVRDCLESLRPDLKEYVKNKEKK